ncbi:MbtH family NRPS accessory protein [Phytohabitans sp. ZYX-F-186]|uniref:MbtH family NRPS accessory protein n=1 Tax=Phytohabitans maris TaxID=3071409 RepID=A0ABU0ZR84_9ACTN|nr:MbtH family NRPS accessory protein [Phytohabitans sp. ZYX-F-186]MDQ7909537.1 MbtH family NRPS accessory protein [Phytohabitans sp. ZYX-F-186]
MAQNPFDDDNGSFYALVNREEQHSLWPTFKPVPGGWTIVYGEPDGRPRQEVLDWIDEHWTDIRPKSLRDHIAKYEAQKTEGANGSRATEAARVEATDDKAAAEAGREGNPAVVD